MLQSKVTDSLALVTEDLCSVKVPSPGQPWKTDLSHLIRTVTMENICKLCFEVLLPECFINENYRIPLGRPT